MRTVRETPESPLTLGRVAAAEWCPVTFGMNDSGQCQLGEAENPGVTHIAPGATGTQPGGGRAGVAAARGGHQGPLLSHGGSPTVISDLGSPLVVPPENGRELRELCPSCCPPLAQGDLGLRTSYPLQRAQSDLPGSLSIKQVTQHRGPGVRSLPRLPQL